jgi:hypothetical protein
MWIYFHWVRFYWENAFFWSFVSWTYLEIHRTRDFVAVNNLKFLSNSIRMFTWNQSTKMEGFFFIIKNIRINLRSYILWVTLTSNNNLLFKDRFKAITVYSWNTRFSNNFIGYSFRLICWISICNINKHFLFEEFLSISSKFNLNSLRFIRFDWS